MATNIEDIRPMLETMTLRILLRRSVVEPMRRTFSGQREY